MYQSSQPFLSHGLSLLAVFPLIARTIPSSQDFFPKILLAGIFYQPASVLSTVNGSARLGSLRMARPRPKWQDRYRVSRILLGLLEPNDLQTGRVGRSQVSVLRLKCAIWRIWNFFFNKQMSHLSYLSMKWLFGRWNYYYYVKND